MLLYHDAPIRTHRPVYAERRDPPGLIGELVQALQQWSTMSSKDSKIRFESQFGDSPLQCSSRCQRLRVFRASTAAATGSAPLAATDRRYPALPMALFVGHQAFFLLLDRFALTNRGSSCYQIVLRCQSRRTGYSLIPYRALGRAKSLFWNAVSLTFRL
jgi:hypothetical protein